MEELPKLGVPFWLFTARQESLAHFIRKFYLKAFVDIFH